MTLGAGQNPTVAPQYLPAMPSAFTLLSKSSLFMDDQDQVSCYKCSLGCQSMLGSPCSQTGLRAFSLDSFSWNLTQMLNSYASWADLLQAMVWQVQFRSCYRAATISSSSPTTSQAFSFDLRKARYFLRYSPCGILMPLTSSLLSMPTSEPSRLTSRGSPIITSLQQAVTGLPDALRYCRVLGSYWVGRAASRLVARLRPARWASVARFSTADMRLSFSARYSRKRRLSSPSILYILLHWRYNTRTLQKGSRFQILEIPSHCR